MNPAPREEPGALLRAAAKDYLEAILELEGQTPKLRSADLACYLGVTRASVCRAVGQLRGGGFLAGEGKALRLTEQGRAAAQQARERRRFFEELLLAAGVNPAQAKADAGRMKHAVSDESYARLRAQNTGRKGGNKLHDDQ